MTHVTRGLRVSLLLYYYFKRSSWWWWSVPLPTSLQKSCAVKWCLVVNLPTCDPFSCDPFLASRAPIPPSEQAPKRRKKQCPRAKHCHKISLQDNLHHTGKSHIFCFLEFRTCSIILLFIWDPLQPRLPGYSDTGTDTDTRYVDTATSHFPKNADTCAYI